MAAWMTMLPAVRAVMSRPCRMGTPDEISTPSVRLKRAIAVFCITLPMTGARSSQRSTMVLPCSVLCQRRKRKMPTIISPRPGRKVRCTNSESASTNLVGRGQFGAEVGEHLGEDGDDLDQHEDRRAGGDAGDHNRIDHRALDLAVQGVGLFEVRRRAAGRRMASAPLASPAATMCTKRLSNTFLCLAIASAKRRAAGNGVVYVADGRAEGFILASDPSESAGTCRSADRR